MTRTLILYDGKMSSAERCAERLCYVIGSAKTVEIDEAPSDLSVYDGVCFVFNFYGSVTAGKTKSYLEKWREVLKDKRLAVVGIGFSDLGYTKYIVDMEKEVGLEGLASYFVFNDSQTTRTGYEISRYMRTKAKAMEEDRLMEEIRSFVSSHTTLALATAADGYIRCTPLEYTFLDDVFYISTEGGSKFRGIIENGRVSAAIFNPLTKLTEGASLQLLGEAESVPVNSPEYKVAMTAKHITEEKLSALPVTVFLIRLTPLRYEFINADFLNLGYDSRQLLNTKKEKKKRMEGEEFFVRERAKGQPTYTIIDEHGDEKQVTIPEIGTNMIPGFFDMPHASDGPARQGVSGTAETEEERKRREELIRRKRRKKALLEKKRREEALLEASKDEEAQKAPGEEKESGSRKKEAGFLGRIGAGIGQMLRLDDDDDEADFGEE